MLARYGLTEANLIARGMEAEVYACGDEVVLKLYRGAPLAVLTRLQAIYAALERDRLSYALPDIVWISDEGEYHVVLERRWPGEPLSVRVSRTPTAALEPLFAHYVDALLELSQVPMPPSTTRYKLHDPEGLSARADGDWHAFLRRWLQHQLGRTEAFLVREVADFPRKRAQIFAALESPYTGALCLVHGDFFGGNLLIGPCRNRLFSPAHV